MIFNLIFNDTRKILIKIIKPKVGHKRMIHILGEGNVCENVCVCVLHNQQACI